MQNEILVNNIKFWVNQNIIYCKLHEDSVVDYTPSVFDDLFSEAISILSNGACLPIIFNFREINSSLAIKLFRLLSNNSKVTSAVLSKAFLVKNYRQKILLSFYVMFSDSNVPNLIFSDTALAVSYSNQNYSVFNSICDGS